MLITSLRIQGSNSIAIRIRSAHMKRYIPLEERQAKAIDILYDAVAEGSWRLKDLWEAELGREKMDGEVLGLQLIAAEKLREARAVLQCLWETVGDGKQP